eukprot:m.38331 g.38331  ORF g.38331 m.38331 type:complete len:934 (-) comp9419_c0_seq1:151-2952(-)
MTAWDAKAEKLFIEHPIDEIKSISRSTTQDIENKKEELRQMVGAQYRDLIDAADTIVAMSDTAAKVIGTVSEMQEICRTIEHGSTTPTSRTGQENEPRFNKRFYGMAMKMKLLMDAPERVWSALEQNEYCNAATLFLVAEQTYQGLQNEKDAEFQRTFRSFPIISRQWSSISIFKKDILDRVKGSYKEVQDDAQVIGGLCAHVILAKIEAEEACQVFLDQRLNAIHSTLSQAFETPSSVQTEVCKVAKLVAVSMRQICTLFYPDIDMMEEKHKNKFKKFYTALQNLESSTNSVGDVTEQTMKTTVNVIRQATNVSVDAIPSKKFAAMCCEWLDRVAGETQKSLPQALRQVNSVKELTAIRDSVWDSLKNEYEKLESLVSALFVDTAEEFDGCYLDQMTQIIAKTRFEPWSRLMQSCFLDRAQVILSAQFQAVAKKASDAVYNICEDTSEDLCYDLSSSIWGAQQNHLALTGQTEIVGWESLPFLQQLSLHTSGYPENVASVIGQISQGLREILEGAQNLLTDSKPPNESAIFVEPLVVFERFGDSAIDIRRYMQTACEMFVDTFCTNISKKRQDLQKINDKEVLASENAQTLQELMQRALFLGRVCKALPDRCTEIETCIMLPAVTEHGRRHGRFLSKNLSDMPERLRNIRKHQKGRRPKNEHDGRLANIKNKCIEEYNNCHKLWAKHIASSHAARFSSRLATRDWQHLGVEKRVWFQHKVDEESESGERVQSVVKLPMQPSGFLITSLCAICSDINTAGGHAIGTPVLKYLASSFLEEVLESFKQIKEGDVSEDGFVQLYFDFSFLVDVLMGPMDKLEDSKLRASITDVLEMIKAGIDPIDLAVFAPLLDENKAKCYNRSVVLLGFLTASHQSHPGNNVRSTQSSSENHNLLALSDAAPRFPLLPLGGTNISSRGRIQRTRRDQHESYTFAY